MVKMEEMSGNLISISPNAEYLGEVVDGMYVMTFSKTLAEKHNIYNNSVAGYCELNRRYTW